MNRAIRRRQAKQIEKKHETRMKDLTVKEINERLLQQGIGREDLDTAREEGRRSGFDAGCRMTTLTCYAAAVKVLKRDFGFDLDRLIDFLTEMDMIAMTTLDKQEIVRETLDETGILIRLEEGVDRIERAEKRPVLCNSCIMGDKVSSGVWDCDMIDGLTGGKTVCKHYRPDPETQG